VSLAEDNPNPLRCRHRHLRRRRCRRRGKQAARAGDTAGCAGSTIVQGSPNVFINGKPAAVQG
jgi:hypothetical protein